MSPSLQAKSQTELVLVALGGMGEIGMNCYAYGLGTAADKRWIIVDLGVKFGDETEPGIDIVLPDPSFLETNRSKLLGIVLTHAHEDHLGAVPWLWPRLQVPVYCTGFAAEILRLKLMEAELLDQVPIKVLPLSARFRLGDFDLEFVSVTHSIPEANALIIRTLPGTVVHTGDWKIDRKPSIFPSLDEARLREVGDEGVRALVCDSTNVLREGHSPYEKEVEAAFDTLIARAPGRVVVTTFGSHVGRVASAANAARRAGREIIVAGRAMRTMIDAARNVGLLSEAGQFLDEQSFGYIPPEKALLMCTGSQGEPRAALARIADDTHPMIALDPGDTVVFSSRTIPGNEKAVSAVINKLARSGLRIVTADQAAVHSSGHPRQGELKELYGWLRPALLVPMHGEAWHLDTHVEFAKAAGIPETALLFNGQMIRLAPGPAEMISEVPTGRLHVDGRMIVPAIDGPSRKRRKLSFVGVILASIVIDDKGDIVTEPAIVTDGGPPEDGDGRPFEAFLADALDTAFNSMPRPRRRNNDALRETLRNALRRAAEDVWGKKPVCHVVIHRV
jgi:ribonuclease J